jgi:SAM-dependent methyltransferase
MPQAAQDEIDSGNSSFWDELCGTALAKSIGVVDASPASLKHFDDWFLAFYPYVYRHIPFAQMANRDVLEVGLGYGTVSQKIAEAGARFCGLDIAQGPVNMVNHRLRQVGLPGAAQRGSILAAPFADESFDYVVTIGCLHHTGDVEKAIAECYRLLRPGGTFIVMVYNAYSLRRWYQAGGSTLTYLMREIGGYRGVVESRAAKERAAYDSNQAGDAAPHTDWISVKSLRYFCRGFKSFAASRENFDRVPRFSWASREWLLQTPLPAIFGLDIYATARK